MLNTSASSARVRSDVFEYEYGMTGRTCHKGTDEQAAYIGVPKEGPYKPDHYRY